MKSFAYILSCTLSNIKEDTFLKYLLNFSTVICYFKMRNKEKNVRKFKPKENETIVHYLQVYVKIKLENISICYLLSMIHLKIVIELFMCMCVHAFMKGIERQRDRVRHRDR